MRLLRIISVPLLAIPPPCGPAAFWLTMLLRTTTVPPAIKIPPPLKEVVFPVIVVFVMVALESGPTAMPAPPELVLAENQLSLMLMDPEASSPPPSDKSAWFPAKIVSVTVNSPVLQMPPPPTSAKLSAMVLLRTRSVPRFVMAPPHPTRLTFIENVLSAMIARPELLMPPEKAILSDSVVLLRNRVPRL